MMFKMALGRSRAKDNNNGLVNGSQSDVKKMWFNCGSNPCSHLPAVLFIEFQGYSSLQTPTWDGIEPSWVLIILSTATWEIKSGK